jgi:hypothetical protein
MNNASFVLLAGMSLLEAHFRNVMGVYMRDFPDQKTRSNLDETRWFFIKKRNIYLNSVQERT